MEPLFDDLLQHFPAIRNIWAMDPATYGESFQINRDVIGDEPNWLDVPRDLLHMINHFQELMPPPLIAIGSSLGAALLTILSTWHPRLFSGLILAEPAYGPRKGYYWPSSNKLYPARLVAKRRESWPSREDARKAFAKSPLYRSYDPRVIDKVLEHELVDVKDGVVGQRVALRTPKSIITSIWVRAIPRPPGLPANPGDDIPIDHQSPVPGFGRPEAPYTWGSLPFVYPPVLLIWGEESELFGNKIAHNRNLILDPLGTGHGGGGGISKGQVDQACIPGVHHGLVFESPLNVAKAAASWSKKIREEWLKKMYERKSQPAVDHSKVNEEVMARFAKL